MPPPHVLEHCPCNAQLDHWQFTGRGHSRRLQYSDLAEIPIGIKRRLYFYLGNTGSNIGWLFYSDIYIAVEQKLTYFEFRDEF